MLVLGLKYYTFVTKLSFKVKLNYAKFVSDIRFAVDNTARLHYN